VLGNEQGTADRRAGVDALDTLERFPVHDHDV
jgi:hypothetical protein